MTLRFVKTSILSSEDGIDFSKEVALETEEAKNARIAKELAQSKPLYEQLAANKAKKQEEYDENTKKIYAPPKALEDDDVQYFKQLEESKNSAMAARAANEEKLLESFRNARKHDQKADSSSGPALKFTHQVTKKADVTVAPAVLLKKKKIADSVPESNKKLKTDEVVETIVEKIEPVSVPSASAPTASLGFLNDYGSDSD